MKTAAAPHAFAPELFSCRTKLAPDERNCRSRAFSHFPRGRNIGKNPRKGVEKSFFSSLLQHR
ncbi:MULTISPECIES: hypothetical protein [Burkholderia]|uniref:hypothetical protein n=1 Tax=Burkholderia TaxID=32008 RepID=UPI000A98FB78|nr:MULTISPECIES: hypothetical protein [Burkholderia]MBN3742941.1 hypothetical protein [Burkholderia sp. Tr-20355]